jgi:hypothetical protein
LVLLCRFRDFRKPIDFEKEYNKFIELDKEVNSILINLFKNMGGRLLEEDSKK